MLSQVFQPVFDAAETLSIIRQHSVTSFIAVPAMVVSLCEAAHASRPVAYSRRELSVAASAPASTPARQSRSITNASSQPHDRDRTSIRETLLLRGNAAEEGNTVHSSSRLSVGGRVAYQSMRVVLLGGGELPRRLKGPLQVLFPTAQILTAYGMTEACSSMTFGPLDMQRNASASAQPPQHLSSAPAAKQGVAADFIPQALSAQDGAKDVRRSLVKLEDRKAVGAGGIPVGWPPPGIEMGIAPPAGDASSACREVLSQNTAVRQLTRLDATPLCAYHCMRSDTLHLLSCRSPHPL